MNSLNPFDLLDEDDEEEDKVIEKKPKEDKITDKYKNIKTYNKVSNNDNKSFINKLQSNDNKSFINKLQSNDNKPFINKLQSNDNKPFINKLENNDRFASKKNELNNSAYDKNAFQEVSKTRYKKEENVVIIKNFDNSELLNKLPIYFKMYVLHVLDKGWNDILSFNNIFTLLKWNDISEVINSLILHKDKIINFNLSFMKNNISPIWEDNENRYGSRTNIQIYDLDESLELLKLFLINIANRTLLNKNINNRFYVNGIAFYPKKDLVNNKNYQIIQIWYNLDITKSFKIFNDSIENLLKKKNYSVRTRLHTPQF